MTLIQSQIRNAVVILVIWNITLAQANNQFNDHNGTFDFRDIINRNKKYPPMQNTCSLRIYGGVAVDPGEIPYQVALRKEKFGGRAWVVFCGGAIITDKHIVSAAHCFETGNLMKMRVIAGTTRSNVYLFGSKKTRRDLMLKLQNKEVWRRIAECYRHAYYNRMTIRHDLAVLLLDEPVRFTETIRPIPMVHYEITVDANTVCATTGYGIMDGKRPSAVLRKVCVPVIPFDVCYKAYYSVLFSRYTQICAGSYMKDSCQGDSGGPMACKGHLVGLVSFGGKCGEAPGVYTLLSGYTTGSEVPFLKNVSVKLNCAVIKSIFVFTTTISLF